MFSTMFVAAVFVIARTWSSFLPSFSEVVDCGLVILCFTFEVLSIPEWQYCLNSFILQGASELQWSFLVFLREGLLLFHVFSQPSSPTKLSLICAPSHIWNPNQRFLTVVLYRCFSNLIVAPHWLAPYLLDYCCYPQHLERDIWNFWCIFPLWVKE